MASATENTQIHRSVLLDHKIIIEGVQYHEKKELERVFKEDGVEMSILSHMRSIGDRTYTANQNIVDGVVQEETIDTNLADEEVAEFKKNWVQQMAMAMAAQQVQMAAQQLQMAGQQVQMVDQQAQMGGQQGQLGIQQGQMGQQGQVLGQMGQAQMLGPDPIWMTCPNCKTEIFTTTRKITSTFKCLVAGSLYAFVLFAFAFPSAMAIGKMCCMLAPSATTSSESTKNEDKH